MGGTVSASRWESCIFPLCLSVYPCWTLEDPCGKGVLLTSRPWDERDWDLLDMESWLCPSCHTRDEGIPPTPALLRRSPPLVMAAVGISGGADVSGSFFRNW